ncbi:MAG: SAM-dependent methyltransferase [Clostridia bacterium]|nr:SAM-dependent methyltransferase [Clostridia bacterium]
MVFPPSPPPDAARLRPQLDARLAAAASFVREGAVAADIGTDHALLPLFLLAEGRIRFAVASDIHRGPLERAKRNAALAGLSDRMRFALADGLKGLAPERDGVTDILICGMGGELIARIVGESEFTRKPGIRLILCPMSQPDKLREFLAGAGFAVLDEKLAEAAGKRYAVLCAEYDGQRRDLTPAERLLGRANIEKNEPLFIPFASEWLARVERRIEGRREGGLDTADDEILRNEIEAILKEKTADGNGRHRK